MKSGVYCSTLGFSSQHEKLCRGHWTRYPVKTKTLSQRKCQCKIGFFVPMVLVFSWGRCLIHIHINTRKSPSFLVCKAENMNLGKKSRAGLSQLHLQTTSLWQPAGCLKTGAVDASLQKAHRCCSECQREETLKKKEFCCLLSWTEWAPPFPSHSLPTVTSSRALGTGHRAQVPAADSRAAHLAPWQPQPEPASGAHILEITIWEHRQAGRESRETTWDTAWFPQDIQGTSWIHRGFF